MKFSLFVLGSIVLFPLATRCMDADTDTTESAPLQTIVIEKLKTLKEAYDAGIRPHKDNTALNCTHQCIAFLDDLSTLTEQWHLQTLTSLDLSHNHIEKFPKELFIECPHLMGISLAHNRLTEIAPDLPYHRCLTTLYLHNNNFKGIFPLAYLLRSAPVAWLTLHRNPKIIGFGNMPHKYKTLEQLFIDHRIAKKERIKIARQCPKLEAEICESGTEVQEAHSIKYYTDKYYLASGNGACWGLSGGLCCFVGIGVAAGLGHPAGVIVASGVAAAGGGITIGTITGWQIAVRCCLKPEEMHYLRPIASIAKYPFMLAELEEKEKDEANSDSTRSDSDSVV